MRRVVFLAGAPNSPGPAAKESGGQARLRLAVIVTAIVVTSAVALSPFFVSLALHVSNNRTHDKEMVHFFLFYRRLIHASD